MQRSYFSSQTTLPKSRRARFSRALPPPGSAAFLLMMRVKSLLRNWHTESQEGKFPALGGNPKSRMPVSTRESLWRGLPCPHVPSRRATAKAGVDKAPAFFVTRVILFHSNISDGMELAELAVQKAALKKFP